MRPAVAVAVCMVGAALSVVVPFVGIPIAAGALATLWYGGHKPFALLVAVLGGALTLVMSSSGLSPMGIASAVHIALWLLVAGPLAAALLRRWPAVNVLLVVAGLSIVLIAGLFGVTAALQGESVQAFVSSQVRAVIEPFVTQALAPDAATSEVPAAVAEEINALVDSAVRAWPSAIAVEAGLAAMLALVAVGMVAVRSGVPVRSVPRFEALDLSPHVIWGLIAGVALVAADKFLGGWNDGVLGLVGENALRITQWVLFLQGIAVFASLYRRAGLGRITRTLGFVLLGVTEAFVPLVSLTGLIDMWVNVRKLPRDGQPKGDDDTADSAA
ncbi:MAG TPA: DUF2232 domain-containing protein [Coriobacteriia bacterium]|nr:DUF2232 domain-containing protein [Coriobacteriia bacterium]